MKFRSLILLGICIPALLNAGAKLTTEDRLKLVRGLTAEFANSKVPLPRSKKPLEMTADGQWNKTKWDDAMRENGPAAKPGDQIQITKVDINDDNIVLEINGGLKNGTRWRDRIQVSGGVGMRGGPLNGPGQRAMGTSLVLKFAKPIEPIEVAEVKKLLTPVFQFDLHSATESFVENLPPEIQKAIKDQKAIEGMDREQVQIAMGRPKYKTRETKDGMELEDWVYGQPPGKIVFVTFNGNKVLKVKESYAGIGGGDLSAPPK